MQYLNKCSGINTYNIYNVNYSNSLKNFIFYILTQADEFIHVGVCSCNSKCVVKVLDCLVALQQKSGRPLLSTRSPEFVQLTVKAFL